MPLLYIIFALFTKHFIVDFLLQTPWMAFNKHKFGHPGGLVHAGLHGLSTYAILVFFYVPGCEGLALFDFLSHYLIDYAKMNLNLQLGYTPKDKEFWYLLGADQYCHALVYFLITAKAMQ